jgi:hypothetical protein
MRILSVGKIIKYDKLDIISIEASSLEEHHDIEQYQYIIINGGDGTIRRVLNQLHTLKNLPIFILNPTGSFNVVAKIHKVPSIEKVLAKLANFETPKIQKHHFFTLNNDLFLFSAGNMGDLQHIFISETLRFGILKHGMLKYILSIILLLPIHLIMTPLMLLSSTKFFIFTPAHFIKKFGSFYGEVKDIKINLENEYNILELDGDIVTVHGKYIHISEAGNIFVVTQ